MVDFLDDQLTSISGTREEFNHIEFNRGVNELNRGVNDLNRGVNHSVARQGSNLLRAAVTSAVTSQGCCCGNLQIHPLDLGQWSKNQSTYKKVYLKTYYCDFKAIL